MEIIRIGTRSSRLALIQTQYLIDAIHAIDPSIQCKIVTMESSGDRNIDQPLTSFATHGVFCDELEAAILQGTIDVAVHSSKDMSLELPEGLSILGALQREDPREILIQNRNSTHKLHRIGTCSHRRQIQIKKNLSDIQCLPLRGDVETRLNKLANGMYDGIILAAAGVIRLRLQDDERFQFQYYDVNEFVPAPGQGIIAIEGSCNSRWKKLIEMITDPISFEELKLERSIYEMLEDKDNGSSSVHVNIHKQQPYNMSVWLLIEENNLITVKGFYGEIDETLGTVKRYLKTIGMIEPVNDNRLESDLYGELLK